MRFRTHWTPRYVKDRAVLEVRERTHPDDPWWTAQAVALLDSLLRRTDHCFEWGSGRSTAWLAQRTASVVSVEHDPAWHREMAPKLAGLPATVHLVPAEEQAYVAPIDDQADLDLVVVDGLFRDACTDAALDRLRPGGLLVIDNVERHLPNSSHSPESIGRDHENDRWRGIDERLGSWRRIWTSNGVRDTAIFIAER